MRTEKIWNKFSRFVREYNAAAESLLFVIFVAYLACRHWHTVSTYFIYVFILVFFPVVMHLWSQFYYARRIINSMGLQSGTTKSDVYNLLFRTALTNLLLLVFIAALLRHIDGFI